MKKKERKKRMKKLFFACLFSSVVLAGGINVFADEIGITPVTPPVIEETTPVVPIPDISKIDESVPDQPTPVDPDISSEVTEPTTPVVPDITENSENETPVVSPSTGETTNDKDTTPTTSESYSGTSSVDNDSKIDDFSSSSTTIDTPKETEKKNDLGAPKNLTPENHIKTVSEKEMTVSVSSDGKIVQGTGTEKSIPIVTSNLEEINHVPTSETPLQVATGQAIVGVQDGVPLVQDNQGNLVEDLSIPVKKLPSGNIEIKTIDGKTKVLPKTGEELQISLTILDSLLTAVTGGIFYGKKQWRHLRHMFKKTI
ncbi:peptidase [Enterococcus faecium]